MPSLWFVNIIAIRRATIVRHREIWKFGGTSVNDAKKRRALGEKIAQANHMDVVVVVSAAAGVTDSLHQEIGALAEVPQHLIDSYVATGEMMSASLVAAAVHAAGRPTAVVPATLLFSCDNRFGDGTVRAVQTAPILRLLRQRVVPVGGGFFGLSADGRLITLGRGGSNYSAVLLAAALGCDVCLFKASCDGVYDADPNWVTVARRYQSLTHDQACDLAANGAKVLQAKASDLARTHKVTIRVRPAFTEGFGTVIKAS
jgi:aspartate kinase